MQLLPRDRRLRVLVIIMLLIGAARIGQIIYLSESVTKWLEARAPQRQRGEHSLYYADKESDPGYQHYLKLEKQLKLQTNELPSVDSVDVCRLGNTDDPTGFPVDASYQVRRVAVEEQIQVNGSAAGRIAALWRRCEIPFRSSMSSAAWEPHSPPYGLRFYRQQKLLLEVSIDWEHGNCCLHPDQINDGQYTISDPHHLLLKRLKEILPLKPSAKTSMSPTTPTSNR